VISPNAPRIANLRAGSEGDSLWWTGVFGDDPDLIDTDDRLEVGELFLFMNVLGGPLDGNGWYSDWWLVATPWLRGPGTDSGLLQVLDPSNTRNVLGLGRLSVQGRAFTLRLPLDVMRGSTPYVYSLYFVRNVIPVGGFTYWGSFGNNPPVELYGPGPPHRFRIPPGRWKHIVGDFGTVETDIAEVRE
jgi:hypothetical protein